MSDTLTQVAERLNKLLEYDVGRALTGLTRKKQQVHWARPSHADDDLTPLLELETPEGEECAISGRCAMLGLVGLLNLTLREDKHAPILQAVWRDGSLFRFDVVSPVTLVGHPFTPVTGLGPPSPMTMPGVSEVPDSIVGDPAADEKTGNERIQQGIEKVREATCNSTEDKLLEMLSSLSLSLDVAKLSDDAVMAARDTLMEFLAAAMFSIPELMFQRQELLDTVQACLVAAGASTDMDEMEKQVEAAGTNPSHFIRSQLVGNERALRDIDHLLHVALLNLFKGQTPSAGEWQQALVCIRSSVPEALRAPGGQDAEKKGDTVSTIEKADEFLADLSQGPTSIEDDAES